MKTMMKKLSPLSFLAGIIGLAFVLLLAITPAYAHGPICQNLEGGPCSPDGSQRSCVDAIDGGPGLCICTDGLWDCGTGFSLHQKFAFERVGAQDGPACPAPATIPWTMPTVSSLQREDR